MSRLLLGFGLMLVANAGLVAAEPALSLADLEAIALQNNPTLAQASANIDAAHAKALQAGLYPNPTIGYVGEQIGAEGTAGELQGAFVQQTIITAGKLRLSRAKYCQEAREAAILAMAQQLRVLNALRLHYYRLLALERMIGLHGDLLRNAEESLRTTREQFNIGQATRADVLLAEVEQNEATLGLRRLENQRQAAWEALRALVGAPELATQKLAGDLEPSGEPLDWQASLDRLLQDSPQIQAALAHVVHDQIALQRERVEPIPNVTIQAASGYNYETSNAVAGVQVGIELPIFDRNQGTIRQAQADLARSHAEVRRLELVLRSKLAEVFSTYRTAWEAVALQRQSVDRTKEAHAIMLDMYEKRRAPWPTVVRLQRQLFDIQSQYTRNLLELREAEVSITGLLLTDGLAEPQLPTPGGHIEATPKPR